MAEQTISPIRIRRKVQAALANPRPWLTSGAVDWLQTQVRSTDRVLEFGGGGSTLWFLERCRWVRTREASLEYAQALLAVVGSRPELLARWRLDFANCFWRRTGGDWVWKGAWKEHHGILDDEVIEDLEAAYVVDVDEPVDLILSDGGPDRRQTLRAAIRVFEQRHARILVVDNTESRATSDLADRLAPAWSQRRDFVEEHEDRIPAHQDGWVTSIWVRDGAE